MKLYQTPKAPNPDRVVYFLRAKGRLEAVELVDVNIMAQEHKTPEYRALSPFAKVPVLVLDDGTTLTESRAICTYFEGIFPEPNLMGATPLEKAQIEMWDRQIELMFFVQFAGWFRNAHPAMAPLENPQCPETAAKSERNAKAFVKRLDAHLAENEYVAAGRFSIADITAFISCRFSKVMQWAPHKENAKIAAWYERIRQTGIAG